MEISFVKVLANGISSFLHLSFPGNMNLDPVSKYYQKAEDILKLLKPIIDAIVDSDLASDELLSKLFEELGPAVDEVMQVEPLICRIWTSGLDILNQLKETQQCFPDDFGDETSSVIKEAMMEQLEGAGPSSEVLAKIAEILDLRSNQEVLIEAVALEKLKESAEQTEKPAEAEYIDQMISVVTCMHERLVMLKQSQSGSPVSVPADFCCPLSLELMTDPVIVASGQTYERAFIKNWIDLGLTVCPKTRQTLAHTNLIPNYTVKALIANWCESNNLKLLDPGKSKKLKQPSALNGYMESGTTVESPVVTSLGETHKEGTSPLRHHSTSEGSLSCMVNGQNLDLAGISPPGSDDRSASSDEGSVDSIGKSLISPSRRESFNAFSSEQSQTHVRTVSDSSALSSANFPQGSQGDNNNAAQLSTSPGNSQDASGELDPGTDAAGAAAMPASHREPEFSPHLVDKRSRSQTIWRRSSDRFRV